MAIFLQFIQRNRTTILIAAVSLLIVTSLVYWYRSSNVGGEVGGVSKTAEQESVDDLVAQVGKLLVLPTDEVPTIATVTNLEALSGQQFFEHAQVGNKVLIYSKARKAILFDPSINKIVEVAPVNLGTTSK